MSEPQPFAPNRYGKVVLLCIVVALGAVALDGPTALLVGAVSLAVLTVAWAMYRNGSEDGGGRYPHDRGNDLSEREKQRQKEMEAEKGRALGESL